MPWRAPRPSSAGSFSAQRVGDPVRARFMPGCGPGVPAAVVVAPRLTTAGGVHEEPYPATRARSSSAPRSPRHWPASWQAVLIRHGGPGFGLRRSGSSSVLSSPSSAARAQRGVGGTRSCCRPMHRCPTRGHGAPRSQCSRPGTFVPVAVVVSRRLTRSMRRASRLPEPRLCSVPLLVPDASRWTPCAEVRSILRPCDSQEAGRVRRAGWRSRKL